MDVSLYYTLKVVHLAAMALWVGGPLLAPLALARALEEGGEWARREVQRLQRLTPYFVAAALTTVVSGGLLLWAAGGWAAVRPTVVVGAGVAVLTFPLGGGVVRPTLNRLEAASDGPRELRRALHRRFLWAHWSEVALRGLALVLMVVPVS